MNKENWSLKGFNLRFYSLVLLDWDNENNLEVPFAIWRKKITHRLELRAANFVSAALTPSFFRLQSKEVGVAFSGLSKNLASWPIVLSKLKNGTIHLRRRRIFTIFDPYPPPSANFSNFWPLLPRKCRRLKWMIPMSYFDNLRRFFLQANLRNKPGASFLARPGKKTPSPFMILIFWTLSAVSW